MIDENGDLYLGSDVLCSQDDYIITTQEKVEMITIVKPKIL